MRTTPPSTPSKFIKPPANLEGMNEPGLLRLRMALARLRMVDPKTISAVSGVASMTGEVATLAETVADFVDAPAVGDVASSDAAALQEALQELLGAIPAIRNAADPSRLAVVRKAKALLRGKA